jgi:cell division protein FtsL
MAYATNTSSAYDLSAFEEGKAPKRLRREDVKVVKTPKQFLASIVTVKNLVVFLMAITVVCLMVYNNVCLTEVTGQINALNDEMTELTSDYVKLQSKQGSTMSPRAVAELAESELGLKRMDKYQTEYIVLYHEDKIEVTEDPSAESLGVKAKLLFTSAISAMKEYMAAR